LGADRSKLRNRGRSSERTSGAGEKIGASKVGERPGHQKKERERRYQEEFQLRSQEHLTGKGNRRTSGDNWLVLKYHSALGHDREREATKFERKASSTEGLNVGGEYRMNYALSKKRGSSKECVHC